MQACQYAQTRWAAVTQFEFTLVILIISIFLLFYTPRLKELSDRGHQMVVKGDAKAFEGMVTLAQARYSIMQMQGAVANMPSFANGQVDFNRYGFPNSVQRGATNEAPLTDQDCVDLWNALLEVNMSTVSINGDSRYYARIRPVALNKGAKNAYYCEYLYQPILGMKISYYPQDGRVEYELE